MKINAEEYVLEEFTERVVKFNTVCGKVVKYDNVKEAFEAALNQMSRVYEECLEGVEALRNEDRIEQLDALVDILVTIVILPTIAGDYDGTSDEALIEIGVSKDKMDYFKLTRELVETVYPTLVERFTDEEIIDACNKVLDNNDMKYTDDIVVANDWKKHIDEETHFIREVEYEGKTYYSIIRKEDDKIEKSFDFKPVVLDLH